VDFGHDILAIEHDTVGRCGAQRDMQDSAVLGGVELGAAAHRLEPPVEVGLACQGHQQCHGLLGGVLAAVIEQHAIMLSGQGRAALRVLEQIAEMRGTDGLHMACEGFPGWGRGDRHGFSAGCSPAWAGGGAGL
jgi:hypothetical protein